MVADRCEPAGRLQRVAAGFVIAFLEAISKNQLTCAASERASEPRERSAPAPRRASERVGESEGRSPSGKTSARICQTLPIFGTSDVVTVTTFVTGARLDAADRQKAAGL